MDAIVLDELLDAIEWLVLVREIEFAERICWVCGCFGFGGCGGGGACICCRCMCILEEGEGTMDVVSERWPP